jgi:hypothetical protein
MNTMVEKGLRYNACGSDLALEGTEIMSKLLRVLHEHAPAWVTILHIYAMADA